MIYLRNRETYVRCRARPPGVLCKGCCRGELWLGLVLAVNVQSEV